MTRVGDERLAEMLAAAEKATPVAYKHPKLSWVYQDREDLLVHCEDGEEPLPIYNIADPASISAIITELVELRKEVATATRIATDRRYMMEAYYAMLGPLGREVADQWKANGVLRQHTSWGPEAWKLSGEERARLLLDAENAPKTRIDTPALSSPTLNSEDK